MIGNAARYAAPLARCGPSALQMPSARHGFDALRLPARLAGRYVGQDPVALTTRMRPVDERLISKRNPSKTRINGRPRGVASHQNGAAGGRGSELSILPEWEMPD